MMGQRLDLLDSDMACRKFRENTSEVCVILYTNVLCIVRPIALLLELKHMGNRT